jgi:superfamily I DNA/RNA helicase
VFIAGCSQGFAGDADRQKEEDRLLYVGLTRAIREVCISAS